MPKLRCTARLFLFVLASAALAANPLSAQPFPSRPVKIIVGNTPGGQSDVLARSIGEFLGRAWKQPVVIENRPGAGSTIAAELVAQAAPDGYTLLLASTSNLVLATALGQRPRYDPLTDFAPIGRIAHVPLGLVVSATTGPTTVAELIAAAKRRPRELTYGSVGAGSMTRVALELLKSSESIDILEVAYRGAAPALADLLAGRIDTMFFDVALIEPHVRAGRLRLLAPAGRRRIPWAPEQQTLHELGVNGFPVEPWYGMVAPARTAPETLHSLRTALATLRLSPEVRARLEQLGYEPLVDTPAELSQAIATQLRDFTDLMKRAGVPTER